jgi:REP element-mobilizing transposase RayT
MWFLPVWTRQGHTKEKPQCENGKTKAMSGGIADTTSSSYRNIDKKQSVAHSARTLARSGENSASQWASNWSKAMPDQVHLCLSLPPKYSVANAVGRWKGQAAIRIHREDLGRRRNFTGLRFWARGYCVSTVGFEAAVIRQYIRNQEEQEKRAEQLA